MKYQKVEPPENWQGGLDIPKLMTWIIWGDTKGWTDPEFRVNKGGAGTNDQAQRDLLRALDLNDHERKNRRNKRTN